MKAADGEYEIVRAAKRNDIAPVHFYETRVRPSTDLQPERIDQSRVDWVRIVCDCVL